MENIKPKKQNNTFQNDILFFIGGLITNKTFGLRRAELKEFALV